MSAQQPVDLDYALLRRVARGENAALAELIRRHQVRLFHLAYRLLKNRTEAEDAVQEVFIKAYKNASRFEPKSTVSAWLHRITANHCLNRLRQHNPLDSSEEGEAEAIGDPAANPLEALEERDLARRLEELLNALPEKQRRALVLKRFAGFSYQEIATNLGTSAAAVDGLLKRARQFLRAGLKDDWE